MIHGLVDSWYHWNDWLTPRVTFVEREPRGEADQSITWVIKEAPLVSTSKLWFLEPKWRKTAEKNER